ncbi:MAG: tRNA (adenosine(37)-N6)-dimethylallyltransferase MiaA [Oscillospiraceae bacterium]|nr:tRNA (adenosine(37)-N6)-dimethylallyltransferase MiaA [Oscillospiraceae bacterium]
MKKDKIPFVAVVGPTASGKTALSIALAKVFDAEVVSADSMQIYKGMDIATAKPTTDEMQNIAHHLIGFVDISQKFSVAQYLSCARNCINDIYSRGKKIIVTGGTGLYVSSLVDNIQFEDEAENQLRAELTHKAEEHGGAYMLEQLKILDPEYANELHENDITRIIRGIEINRLFGHTMSEHKRISRLAQSPYDVCMLGIAFRDRQKLYNRIDKRVEIMLQNGLEAEARHFFGKFDSNKTAVQAIGYKELFPYLEGRMSLDEAADNLKRATRNYAKRQLTWFRKDERIHWLHADEMDKNEIIQEANSICDLFYSNGEIS